MVQEILEKKQGYFKSNKANKAMRVGRNCILVYWRCWYKSVNKS